MSVLENFKNIPRSPCPMRGRQAQNVIFFLQICNEVPGRKKGGACRPLGGRQGPVAPGVGDRGLSPVGRATGPPLFFLQGFRCKFEEKKLYFGPVALWEGDRGIFLKFSKTDIYF